MNRAPLNTPNPLSCSFFLPLALSTPVAVCGQRPLFENKNKKDQNELELLASYREQRIVGGNEAEVASAPW